MVKKIVFVSLTILWMIVIFLFSSQKATDSGNLSGSIVNEVVKIFYGHKFDSFPLDKQEEILNIFSTIIRKGAHFTEYGILGVLVYFSITSFRQTNLAYLFGVIYSFIYAMTDELHQTFVDGRAGRFTDVLIDTSGSIVFLLILFAINNIINHYKKKHITCANK